MLTILPLSQVPGTLSTCIAWSDREWRADSGFEAVDWQEEFRRIREHPVDEVFVAFQGDEPVGMIWMLEHEGAASHQHLTPWISNLIVDPAKRRRGIAGHLLAHVEAYAARGGDHDLYLLTVTPQIYVNRDWQVMDTAALTNRQVFVMQKNLIPPPGQATPDSIADKSTPG